MECAVERQHSVRSPVLREYGKDEGQSDPLEFTEKVKSQEQTFGLF